MGLVYAKPVGVRSSFGGIVLFGGAPSSTSAVSDGSSIASPVDSTYLIFDRDTDDQPAYYRNWNLGTVSIASDQTVRRLRFAVRLSRPEGCLCDVTVAGKDANSNIFTFPPSTIRYGGALAWSYGPWLTKAPDGRPWSKVSAAAALGFESVNNLALRVRSFKLAGTSPLLREAWVEIETSTKPAVTVSAPTGTVVSGRPTIVWDTTQAEGLSQTRAIVRVFDAATYGAAGFNPETSEGAVTQFNTGGDMEWVLGQVVRTDFTSRGRNYTAPPGTYRAYVKADVFSSETDDDYANWSDWSYSQFTVSNTPPPTPTIAATANNTTQAVDLTVTTRANMLSGADASIETGIGSWYAQLNAAAPTQSSTHAADGTQSLRWTATALGDTAVATGLYPVTVGQAYRGVLDVRSGAARTVAAHIQWIDSTGGILSTSTGTGSTSSTGAYGTRTVDATAPAGAVYARVRAYVSSAAAGEAHHIDRIGLWPGATGTWTPGGMTPLSLTVLRDGQTPVWRGDVRMLEAAWDASTQTATFADRLATRGVTHTYTVQLNASSNQIQVEAVSSSATITADTKWWFKPVTDPSLDMGGVRVEGDSPAFEVVEDVTVFRPLDPDPDTGEATAVTAHGPLFVEDPSWTVNSGTAAEWDDLYPILTHQGAVLVQSPFGEHRFVRFIQRGWDLRGTPSAPRRKVRIAAVAVTEP